MTTTPSTRQTQAWRPALLLLGAFVFALNVEQSLHELDHALALRAYGIDEVRLVLHPVLGSRTVWQDTTNYARFGVVDAAGPLLPLLLTMALWRWRCGAGGGLCCCRCCSCCRWRRFLKASPMPCRC